MVKLFANSGDLDQTPHSAASDLGLHCLPITLLWVSDYSGLKYVLETFVQSGVMLFEHLGYLLYVCSVI